MAANLDINIVCEELPDMNSLMMELRDNGINVTIEKKSYIDNWMWDNHKEFKNISQMEKLLSEEKIIVINLNTHIFKDMGIYIEKISDRYIYDLWINTEGFPDLDAGTVNMQNEKYFKKIYQIAGSMIKKRILSSVILGIGVETVFRYRENIMDIIRDSDNAAVWIMDKNSARDMILADYKKKSADEADVIIFEKGN